MIKENILLKRKKKDVYTIPPRVKKLLLLILKLESQTTVKQEGYKVKTIYEGPNVQFLRIETLEAIPKVTDLRQVFLQFHPFELSDRYFILSK